MEVEELFLADLAGGGFVLHLGGLVLHLDVGIGVRRGALADEHGIALAEVARARCLGHHAHQTTVGIAAASGADALADDGALGVPADVDHLGAGIRLLLVVGQRHRVELANAGIPEQNAGRVLPGDGAACLDLGPADLGVAAFAEAALGDEIEDAAQAVLVAGIPVLNGAVLDAGVVERHQFHHRRMKLVGVELGRGAAFEVTHGSAFFGHDERPLELAAFLVIDAEVGAQVHGAGDAFRDEDEAAVREDRRIQGRIEIVGGRHHAAEVLLDQVGMLAHCFAE